MGYYTHRKKAKIQWPPGDEISKKDAIETVYALDDAFLGVTKYAEDGKNFAEDLYVDLQGLMGGVIFHRIKLRELLNEEFDPYNLVEIFKEFGVDDFDRDEKNNLNRARTQRLLIRLLRAYHDWDQNEAKMSYEEMKANPIPAIKKDG